MKKGIMMRRTRLSIAIAVLVSGPAMADVILPQSLQEDVYQYGENVIDLNGVGNIDLQLGENGVGSQQFISQQFQAIGWGQSGGSLDSALTVSDPTVVIDQVLDLANYNDFRQEAENRFEAENTAYSARSVRTMPTVTINGLSQIGINAVNVAGINMTGGEDGSLRLNQEQTFPTTYIPWDPWGLQIVDNSIVAGVENAGNVIIDGQHRNAAGELVSAMQFGSNGVNNAVVGWSPSADARLSLAISQSAGMNEVNSGEAWSTGGLFSRVDNTAVAYAENDIDDFVVFSNRNPDPVIRNLDQSAQFSANTLTVISASALELMPILVNDGGSIFDSSAAQSFTSTGAEAGFELRNFALAANGWMDESDWSEDITNLGGGRGGAEISNVGQALYAGINTVSVVGPSSTDANGNKTTAAAGPITIGHIDPAGELHPFVQALSGDRLSVESAWNVEGPVGNWSYNWDSSDNLAGNLAFAFTGVGPAGVNGIDQVQSLNVNAFSTSGDLMGASTNGEFDIESELADLVQTGDAYVGLANLAGAAVTVAGNASASGSQMLSFALNTLSAAGRVEGNFVQLLDDTDIGLQNLMAVSTRDGAATLGSANSPVSQTVVSSLNTMSFGNLANAQIVQSYNGDNIGQNSINVALAQAGGAINAASINQAVLNRFNTIAAIK